MKFWVWLKSLFADLDNRPDWVKEPCPKCCGEMDWLPGRDSNSTAEARFECIFCDYREFRGGWGSESAMEKHNKEYHD